MNWKIEYNKEAVRNLEKIPTSDKNKIFKGIEKLKENADLGKQLVGPLKGLRSMSIGNYKVIYKKELNIITIIILAIGHRKNIYKI
ncbi:MAG: type II toxin-antitoxin system mRNA interferase toxin, RelE/StbE family [Ignavibacteria bacterium]|nr:type II toxin-antitoxin system mRNA interferase toxin, RelE/StbE family [Ignavibacteria bacterium]